MQIFIHCKTTLHVSGVTAPIMRSIKNCTRSLRYRSYNLYRYSPPTRSDRDAVPIRPRPPVQVILLVPLFPSNCFPIRPRWRGVAVQVVWPVPEAAGTVFDTPDDGCYDTRNMLSSFAVNKYLHTVASVGFFIHIILANSRRSKNNLLKMRETYSHVCRKINFKLISEIQKLVQEAMQILFVMSRP